MKGLHYGFYLGGDPRDFEPDEEASTPEEIERHQLACQKWDEAEARGEKLEPEPCPSGWENHPELGVIHATRAPYGMGMMLIDTDDWP